MNEQQQIRPERAGWKRLSAVTLPFAVGIGVLGLYGTGMAAEQAVVLPPPVVDSRPAGLQKAVIAGGCFWGVQGVFQHVKGVTSAVSGYAGGRKETAQYEAVGSGTTGHAEAVEVTFDPKVISYGEILQIYFSVAHDPTQLNRQGPDTGSQYRSAIFPANADQKRVAEAYIAQLEQAHAFNKRVVTSVESSRAFYPAEDYHQDFLERHPTDPYIVINDVPKVEQLRAVFPTTYRSSPVLVASGRS
jgi:peptide-methionine (S)-S-oxide reductase